MHAKPPSQPPSFAQCWRNPASGRSAPSATRNGLPACCPAPTSWSAHGWTGAWSAWRAASPTSHGSAYLSDLAVSSSVQGLGVGKGLVEAVRRETGPEVALALISVPDATGFYERIGMTPIDACYWFGRER